MTKLKIESPDGKITILEGKQAADYMKPIPLTWMAVSAMFADIPFIDDKGNSLTLISE